MGVAAILVMLPAPYHQIFISLYLKAFIKNLAKIGRVVFEKIRYHEYPISSLLGLWLGELKSKKEIIQSLRYGILPKVNQVTYTLDTIYDLNSMTLAQAVTSFH